ncbi:hypothetical protein OHC33_008985 [Knufia fluminis]|uniref:F-box domain-containing protein n=1 Tax=Knufia fluminis TaxID=191047 RepID=A0AAN8E9S1_9EURO|nr:hypothetical protein OHC33_008985 [Knufia fluminis]
MSTTTSPKERVLFSPELLRMVLKYLSAPAYEEVDLTIFGAMRVCRFWRDATIELMLGIDTSMDILANPAYGDCLLSMEMSSLEGRCRKAVKEKEDRLIEQRRDWNRLARVTRAIFDMNSDWR